MTFQNKLSRRIGFETLQFFVLLCIPPVCRVDFQFAILVRQPLQHFGHRSQPFVVDFLSHVLHYVVFNQKHREGHYRLLDSGCPALRRLLLRGMRFRLLSIPLHLVIRRYRVRKFGCDDP